MGSFSIACAVSGLPIGYSEKLVGIKLEKNRFYANQYVPASYPVIGEYDSYGRIEGTDFDYENSAIILFEVWENSHLYFHKENRQNPFSLLPYLKEVKERAEKDLNNPFYKELDRDWTNKDYLYYYLKEYFNNTDYGLILKSLDFAGSKDTHKEGDSFLNRSLFMELILDKIENNTYSAEDDTIITKITSLFSGEMLLGKNITPNSNVHIEQCPDYKQRIKILNLHLKIARKFQKEKEANENE